MGSIGTLGTGEDIKVVLTNRGATRALALLNPLETGSFERRLNKTAKCRFNAVVQTSLGAACCDEWRDLYTWATEIIVFRDGRDAFAGPVTDIEYEYGQVRVNAQDLSAWWGKRFLEPSAPGVLDLAAYFELYHNQAMTIDPIPNFVVNATPTGFTDDRRVLENEDVLASSALRDLSKAGIDWTAYGRRIIAGASEIPDTPTVTLTDNDFTKPLKVEEDGIEMANRIIVRGRGVRAIANDTAAQAFNGVLEDRISDPDLETTEACQRRADTELALRKQPIYIKTPRGATLTPQAGVRLQDLICGSVYRLEASGTCRTVQQDFRLDNVKVTFDGTVKVSFQPVGTVN